MFKLLDILKEVENDKLDNDIRSALSSFDDTVKSEFEKASKQENEGILTATALTLAIPGIINGIGKIAQLIAQKGKFNLTKKNDPAWYMVIQRVTEKIDNYLDTPLNFAMKPFIQDDEKRKKVSKILKALVLATMSIMGSVNLDSIKNTAALINQLAGESSKEILQAIAEHSMPNLIKISKNILTKIL